MKVLNAKVYHNKQYMNPPTLQILVDKIPSVDELVYDSKKRGRYTFYFAEKEGYVSFFVHDPDAEYGYGGSVFIRKLSNNETVSVKGPWSSRPGAMHEIFGIHSVDVSLTDSPTVFERGYTYSAAHVTPDIAQEAMQFTKGYNLSLVDSYGEDVWQLVENSEAVS